MTLPLILILAAFVVRELRISQVAQHKRMARINIFVAQEHRVIVIEVRNNSQVNRNRTVAIASRLVHITPCALIPNQFRMLTTKNIWQFRLAYSIEVLNPIRCVNLYIQMIQQRIQHITRRLRIGLTIEGHTSWHTTAQLNSRVNRMLHNQMQRAELENSSRVLVEDRIDIITRSRIILVLPYKRRIQCAQVLRVLRLRNNHQLDDTVTAAYHLFLLMRESAGRHNSVAVPEYRITFVQNLRLGGALSRILRDLVVDDAVAVMVRTQYNRIAVYRIRHKIEVRLAVHFLTLSFANRYPLTLDITRPNSQTQTIDAVHSVNSRLTPLFLYRLTRIATELATCPFLRRGKWPHVRRLVLANSRILDKDKRRVHIHNQLIASYATSRQWLVVEIRAGMVNLLPEPQPSRVRVT